MDEDHDDSNGVAKITVVKEHVTWMLYLDHVDCKDESKVVAKGIAIK